MTGEICEVDHLHDWGHWIYGDPRLSAVLSPYASHQRCRRCGHWRVRDEGLKQRWRRGGREREAALREIRRVNDALSAVPGTMPVPARKREWMELNEAWRRAFGIGADGHGGMGPYNEFGDVARAAGVAWI